jgi:tRNA G18 (ribose-2'-O)-methylase SpoU
VVRRADARVRVPMRAGVNSLNVAVTAALILYAAGRPRE